MRAGGEPTIFRPGERGSPKNAWPGGEGRSTLGDVQGGQRFHVVLSVAINQEEAIRSAMERARLANPALLEFSLFRLPIQTQSVYRVMLLIPLGAFLVVIFRNVVGISTFGTFMPVLIALAFRETQLLWGIALFSLMVGLGLAFRFYLDRLKLLLVPRLASVLIMVVAVDGLAQRRDEQAWPGTSPLGCAVSHGDHDDDDRENVDCVGRKGRRRGPQTRNGQSARGDALLLADEHRVRVEHVMFVFPELLLLLLAGTLLLGRYTGYRLVEIHRFKTFREL